MAQARQPVSWQRVTLSSSLEQVGLESPGDRSTLAKDSGSGSQGEFDSPPGEIFFLPAVGGQLKKEENVEFNREEVQMRGLMFLKMSRIPLSLFRGEGHEREFWAQPASWPPHPC